MKTTHHMKLHAAPFGMIQSGEKTIELRLYDEKRQTLKVGDTIVFTNTTTGETLEKTVWKLHRFDSFRALYAALPLEKCGYTAADIATADPSDMARYYSPEEQQTYGVIGIELAPSGVSPLTMRAQDICNRYAPDPLGIVTSSNSI